ncbi:hypothetical protein CRV24_000690 [Beauveria bassiana]|nr:hypothetical protein CRV24_000690 [Beauveria bassiana]KAH8720752.1 hypothetical protein HC256_001137 [Beauveria bassiana]
MQPGVKRAPRSPTIFVFDANVAFLFDDLAVSVTLVVGFVVAEIVDFLGLIQRREICKVETMLRRYVFLYGARTKTDQYPDV